MADTPPVGRNSFVLCDYDFFLCLGCGKVGGIACCVQEVGGWVRSNDMFDGKYRVSRADTSGCEWTRMRWCRGKGRGECVLIEKGW